MTIKNELKELFTNNEKDMATYWDIYFKNRKPQGFYTDEEINNLPPPPFQLLFDDCDKNGSFFGGVLSKDLEIKIFKMAGYYRVPDNTPQTELINLFHNPDPTHFKDFKNKLYNKSNDYLQDSVVHRNKNSKQKENCIIKKVNAGSTRKGLPCESYIFSRIKVCEIRSLLNGIQSDLLGSQYRIRLQHNRLEDYYKYSYIFNTKQGKEYRYDECGFIKQYDTSELCVLDNYTKESLIKYIKERVMSQYRDDIKKSWSKSKIIKWYIKHDP